MEERPYESLELFYDFINKFYLNEGF